ncbi:MAG: AAA family ATPase [Parerythrobacter sp.]
MSDLLRFQSDEEGLASQIKQETRGDRNQTIGQVLGGMVVYVSGGQAIINAGPDATSEANNASKPELGPNPYKGLLAFQETDGDRFFGRDAEIEQLWQKFCDLPEVESGVRLLPIYGPSGSGKSSLARAGLIPELARRPIPGRARARVAVLVPGTRPVEALATVLARIATNDPSPVAKTQEFREALLRVTGADGADGQKEDQYDGLRRIADALPDIAISPLIVLVDQLEEIYTLCKDAAERTTFVQNLLCAASDGSNRVSVIVTMRSDFLGETQKYPELNRLFSMQGFLAPVMNKAELREAISRPAELAGYSLGEQTIDRLVYQTEDREGALPLLQFALSQIWEGIEEGISPAVTLEELGGVGGALAEKAERVYVRLQPAQQIIARRIFSGLVELGEGTRDTRRRVAVERLVLKKDEPATVRQVLDKFTHPAMRLITCAAIEDGTETAEVTHEALFDHWVRLQQWLEESRSDLRLQRRLEVAAADWDKMARPEGKLWRSPDLDVLRRYRKDSGDGMTPLEIAFFMDSEQAIKKAERERQRQRRLLVRVLSAGLILTTGATIFATYQMQRSERQHVERLSATAETLLLSDQPLTARIYAVAATGISRSAFVQFLRPLPFYPAYENLLNSVRANSEQNQWIGHEDSIFSASFSPDGRTIVSGGGDNKLRLWNATTGTPIGKPIGKPLVGHEDSISSVSFSPDGRTIVSGSSNNNTLRLWNATTGTPIGKPLVGHEGSVYSVSFSPDGRTIVSGGSDNKLRLWNATTSAPDESLINHRSMIHSVSFSSDGRTLVSGGYDNTVQLWDVATGTSIGQPLTGHESSVNSVSFSPDRKTIVSGSDDNTVRLWDVATRTPIGQPLTGHESSVYSVSFSPDGKTIVSGSGSGVGFANSLGIGDNTVRLWDVTTGTPIGQPLIGRLSVYSVSFSPDGKTLVSGNGDNTLQLWNAVTGKPIGQPLVGHKSPINSVSFSPDGTTLVSGSGSFFGDSDNTVRLWDVTTGTPIGQPLTSHTSMVNSVSFSPDGTTLVSGSSDFTVRLWHISQEKLLQSICNQLRWHPALTIPKTDVEKEAKRTCDRYVWSKEKTSP